jgi:hypothetical protein
MIQVDRGIPVPEVKLRPKPRARKEKCKYPWHEMQIGDSFLVKDHRPSCSIQAMASDRGKRDGRKYTTRVTTKGVRIWRIA